MSTASVKATSIDFTYTGSVTYYTVTTTGIYDVTAFGGQGGVNNGVAANSGGLGAEAGGEFLLKAGDKLAIVVGGQGGHGSGLDGGGGGGGGSFVALSGVPSSGNVHEGCGSFDSCSDTLLVAGGGGGGAGTLFSGTDPHGNGNGQTGTGGAFGYFAGGGGGDGGGGGSGGAFGGGGGGGYLINGTGGDAGFGCSGQSGCGGKSFEAGVISYDPAISTGGSAGGAGGVDSFLGLFISGGGAGGFGGGGGGDQGSAGGGGGSFIDPTLLLSDQTLAGGIESGNGLVVLSFVSPAAGVPELSTWAMMIIGFACLGFAAFRAKKNRPVAAFS
jgi:hypothetical protein